MHAVYPERQLAQILREAPLERGLSRRLVVERQDEQNRSDACPESVQGLAVPGRGQVKETWPRVWEHPD